MKWNDPRMRKLSCWIYSGFLTGPGEHCQQEWFGWLLSNYWNQENSQQSIILFRKLYSDHTVEGLSNLDFFTYHVSVLALPLPLTDPAKPGKRWHSLLRWGRCFLLKHQYKNCVFLEPVLSSSFNKIWCSAYFCYHEVFLPLRWFLSFQFQFPEAVRDPGAPAQGTRCPEDEARSEITEMPEPLRPCSRGSLRESPSRRRLRENWRNNHSSSTALIRLTAIHNCEKKDRI